jgi:hypothetical protein
MLLGTCEVLSPGRRVGDVVVAPPAGSENSVLPHFALQHPVTYRRVVKRNFSQKDDTIMETITVGQTFSVGVNGWVGVVQASSGLPPPSK